jgi:hypothetical protein
MFKMFHKARKALVMYVKGVEDNVRFIILNA